MFKDFRKLIFSFLLKSSLQHESKTYCYALNTAITHSGLPLTGIKQLLADFVMLFAL